jgi:hypothetical protein
MAFITEWNQTAGSFTLPLRSGFTYNMVVSWGDGTADSTVTAYNAASATHNYATGGTYQISITGTCGAFYINNGAVKLKLTKIIDWGSVGFTGLGLEMAFYGCTNLTVIPSSPMPAAAGLTSLKYLFYGCTGLTSIPAGIFSNLTGITTFQGTFFNCTGLTGAIPTDLFRYNTAAYDYAFQSTFQGCNHLTGPIPADLFRYNTTVRNGAFIATFSGCAGLTSIPVDLFRYNTNARSFQNVFQNCSGLTGAIPTDLFRFNTLSTDFSFAFISCSGLASIPVDLFRYNTGNTTFQSTFSGCTGLTSIPVDLFKYNTGVVSAGFSATFSGCTGLTSIPVDLFRYNTQNTAFANIFSGCTGLTSVPVDIFKYNTLVTTFGSAFNGCTGLTSVPVDIFRYNTAATTFTNTFEGCTNLTSIPADLFRYNTAATNFFRVFYGCSNLTGTTDKLFQYNTLVTNFQSALTNCLKLQLTKNIFYEEGSQPTRFLNMSVDFSSCFSRTSFSGIQGEAPDIWNCNYGTGTPVKTSAFSGSGNSIASLSNYCYIPTSWGVAAHCQILSGITNQRIDEVTEKIILTTYRDVIEGESLICYYSTSYAGLVNPANIIPLTRINALRFEATATLPVNANDQTFYIHISAVDSVPTTFENLESSFLHYRAAQVDTQIINVVAPNHVELTSPTHKYNHGLCFYNGYLYGSSRDISGNQIVKIKASDYSVIAQKRIYAHPEGDLYPLFNLDQIVFCSGFLWAQTFDPNTLTGQLIRINPSDLSYMLFIVDAGRNAQPIGTDGINLYVTGPDNIYKLDTSKLIAMPSTYGYYDVVGVALPANTILGTCALIQLHPLWNDAVNGWAYKVFSHSVLIDDSFIYVEMTTGGQPNGYDVSLQLYTYHLQKINKNTMVTAGDVVIPKCTDDMAENGSYIFLAPEFQANQIINGSTWGLLAINKNTLEIKYLKALHQIFNSGNALDLAGYGVFFYDNLLAVQLVASKKTVLIDTSTVESWGANFPIGGATAAVYSFQIEGVDLTASPNELILDSYGWVHLNTWEENTKFLKFPKNLLFGGEGPAVNNCIILNHDSVAAILSIVDTHFGCSVRCVQDAPGVATGTVGTATDQDGNTYDTIVINEKRWFVQSLKTTHFRNGDPIPNLSAALDWQLTEAAAHCAPNGETSKI